jgi:putative ABC transport system permease protein
VNVTGVSQKPAPPPALGWVLLSRFTLRHWRGQPWRALLLLLLLSLGVAVFLSIRLANRAAVASFTHFAGVLSSQVDATIAAPAGLLPESVLFNLRENLAVKGTDHAAGLELIPMVETVCAPPRHGEDARMGARATFTLLGVDLVALQNLASEQRLDRSWLNQSSDSRARPRDTDKQGQDDSSFRPRAGDGELGDILTRKDAVFCSGKLAAREGLGVGSPLELVVNERKVVVHIVGIIPGRADQPDAPSGLLVMDLPALQELSGKVGRLDRIECVFPASARQGPERDRLLERLRAAVGEQALVRTPESRRLAAEVMTRGFRLNLTILSLIALLVGLYLIFQTLDAAVVKRRGEIAVLRALGVRDSEVRRAWLWEAVLLGVGGGVVGIFGGWALAQGTVRAVSQTVNALYYANNAEAAGLHAGEAGVAFLLAVGFSVLAGWLPAKRAASTPPAQLWAQGGADVRAGAGPGVGALARARVGWGLLVIALGLAFCGPLTFSGGTRFALAGYLSALLGVVGAGVVAGDALRLVAWLASWVSRTSAPRQLANSHLRLPTSRHRWAAAGLLCAVAMTGGMSVLVGSFERSVSAWITHLLQADLYLTSDANQAATAYNRISAPAWKKMTSDPAVADWDALLLMPVEFGGGSIKLAASNLAFYKRHGQFSWLKAPLEEDLFDSGRNAALCAVSESFAERFHVDRGRLISVPTPAGVKELRVAGVYTDYGDDQGVVMVDRVHAQEWFATQEVSSLSLVLRQGEVPEDLRARFRREYPGLAVFTNVHLRGEVMRIFRQTFAITYALEAIGVVVALAGLGMTLASILAERRAELTTLRALGMSRNDITHVAAWEGVLLALGGTAGGLVTSLGLGVLLIFVINKQTFGWTLQPAIPWRALAVLGVLVPLAGAVVAGMVGRFSADLPADRTE